MKGFKISLKKMLSLLLVTVMLTFALASCAGESAYDIAVRNGFEGSEADWLESLKGENGKDGSDGKDGADGENGKDGEDGKDGENGKDGISYGSDASMAASVAIRSAVSIFATFEQKQYAGQGREPIISEFSGSGAGVVYKLDKERGDAYIITNYHVVYDADCISENGISKKIELYLYGLHYNEMRIDATFIGGSMTHDLAVLKVEGSEVIKSANVTEITLANSDNVAAGELAVAIGNPESDGISVTSGVISVDSEYVKMKATSGVGNTEMRLMRIDTPVNHGNSGGGLFDKNGRLIGIVNAKLESSEIENIGYAIPSNIAYSVAENVISNYENKARSGVYKATLGVLLKAQDFCSVFDKENMKTVIQEKVTVSEVTRGSASDGKLLVGDVIIAVSCDGVSREVNRRFTVIDFILSLSEGDEVTFTVERGGEMLDVSIKLDSSLFTRVS